MSKRCPSCDKLLSFDSFYKDKQTFTGYACYCKSCNKNKKHQSYLKNKIYVLKQTKEWQRTHKEVRKIIARRYRNKPESKRSARHRQLMRNFGITLDNYNEMVKQCNNTCGICGNTPKDHDKILHVDHDHKTGEIRGLLCSTCNSGIGLLKDDINLLELAIIYLNRRV